MKLPTHPKLTLTAALLLLLPCFAAAPAIAGEVAPVVPPAVSGADSDLPAPDAAPDTIVESLDSGALYQCIQITVWAQDPETGECHEFPNPCSVPDGWNRYFDPETCTNW